MNQALYAHMNNKRKMKKKRYIHNNIIDIRQKLETTKMSSNSRKSKQAMRHTHNGMQQREQENYNCTWQQEYILIVNESSQ
jgi:hypothetical protein